MYLMGLDVGTTGAKAMVIDLQGNVISSGYREYPCIFPKPGWVEQDGDLLVEKTFEACKEAVSKSQVNPKEIISIGFSVQRATFGLVDKENQLIDGKFYVWQDNRAASEIEYIKSKMDEKKLYRIQGQPITPTWGLEKIVWIMRNDPKKYELAEKIVFVSDYVMQRFGIDEFYTERTNGGCSALLDISKQVWSKEILETFAIDENKLPELVNPGQVLGKINQRISEKTGLAVGTLICTGSGDNQCGTLGAGVVEEGNASMSLGTSGVLVVAGEGPTFVDSMGLMVNPSPVEGMYQMEGIQLGAASSYKWARDNIATLEKAMGENTGVDSYVLMEHHLDKSKVGANGVIFMPFLIGSGYPYWNTEAKGLFAGLSFSSTKSDMIRAVMEGITLESKDMYENMKSSGININSLTIIGGATKSPTWRQIIADMFNVKVKRLRVTDATIIGAAILAGVGAGIFKDPKEGASQLVHYIDEVEPIEKNVNEYNELYEIYKKMYQAFNDRGIYTSLSKINH